MNIRAGDLSDRVKIERVTMSSDGAGGFTRSWATLATVWASVLPTGGKETLTDVALQGVQGYRVTVRHGLGIQPEDRLTWGSTVMNIRSAADPDGRKTWTVAFADAGGLPE